MIDSTFFCGIGGSGMLPLACIVRASGGQVAGSDRSLDAGRLAPKFEYLRSLGIALHPQDGSGLAEGMTLVTSAAVEDSIPDVVRARQLGLRISPAPQFLARLLNAAENTRRVGGPAQIDGNGNDRLDTSRLSRHPTVMNGAVMKNFVNPPSRLLQAPWSATPSCFVSEVDESDGLLQLYRPEGAVLTNISPRP